MKRRLFASTAVLFACAATASAADRRVPTTTFPTIAAAVAGAQLGDRIVVGPGVYQEQVVSTVANLHFVGRGAVWDGTLADGTVGVCLTASGGGTTIQGFSFRAGTTVGAQVQLTGDDCVVSNCASKGARGTRFLLVVGQRARVESCRLLGLGALAIDVQGADAVVQKLSFAQCAGRSVSIAGDRAVVANCKFQNCNDTVGSVVVVGTDARVTFNRFRRCHAGVNVDGDGAVVERNRFTETGSAITVQSDRLSVRWNVMRTLVNDASGIVAASKSPTGGGVIENNSVADCTQNGVNVAATNVAVRNNRVSDCGTEFESAFVVSGTGNTLTSNSARGCDSRGFNISGPNNSLSACSAVDCSGDGFLVAGTGNTLTNCSARLCSGEGLDNRDTSATVTGCTFRDNRIDVANSGVFVNAATFAEDNSFETGGASQLQQVD